MCALSENFGMAKVQNEKQVVPRFKDGTPPIYIKQWRKFRGLTQARLADRVGMSTGNLSNIETGKQPANMWQLQALAEALQCEVVDLLIRDPSDPEGIWTIWQQAKPAERIQIVEIAKAVLRTAA